jgi:hypothetical protein
MEIMMSVWMRGRVGGYQIHTTGGLFLSREFDLKTSSISKETESDMLGT